MNISKPILRAKINKHFDTNEIRILCFELEGIGVDYDNLEGVTKDLKIQSLIDFLNRREELSELVKLCEQHRPKVTWQDKQQSIDLEMVREGDAKFSLAEIAPQFIVELNRIFQSIQNDHNSLQERFNSLIDQLISPKEKIDDNYLISAKKGLRHLLDGLNSERQRVKSDSFVLAYDEFSKLVNLDIVNKEFICIGYWGNLHYFMLLGDKKNATIQVYECASKFPIHGVEIFPQSFFGNDYAKLLREVETKLKVNKKRLENFQSVNEVIDYLGWAAQTGGIFVPYPENEYRFINEEIDSHLMQIDNLERNKGRYLIEIVRGSLGCLSDLVNFNLEP